MKITENTSLQQVMESVGWENSSYMIDPTAGVWHPIRQRTDGSNGQLHFGRHRFG